MSLPPPHYLCGLSGKIAEQWFGLWRDRSRSSVTSEVRNLMWHTLCPGHRLVTWLSTSASFLCNSLIRLIISEIILEPVVIGTVKVLQGMLNISPSSTKLILRSPLFESTCLHSSPARPLPIERKIYWAICLTTACSAHFPHLPTMLGYWTVEFPTKWCQSPSPRPPRLLPWAHPPKGVHLYVPECGHDVICISVCGQWGWVWTDFGGEVRHPQDHTWCVIIVLKADN